MNKGQGFAVGALFTGPLMLWQVDSNPPQEGRTIESGKSGTRSSAPRELQVGPLVASYHYWPLARIAYKKASDMPAEIRSIPRTCQLRYR
jgi:hypothetical protein